MAASNANDRDPISAVLVPAVPYHALVRSAVIAGIFCFAVCGLMLVRHGRAKAQDPFKSTQLAALKQQLLAAPKDEQLKTRIRALDFELRGRYFKQVSLNRTGAWLALGGFALFAFAAAEAHRSRRVLPLPQPKVHGAEQAARSAAWSRWSVGAFGALAMFGFAAVAFTSTTSLPRDVAGVERLLTASGSGAMGAADYASLDEMSRNWPRFRGPSGDGVSAETNATLVWDRKAGKGIAWMTEVPVGGFNSPIVWGERIFLAGGDAAKREIVCYAAGDGQLLWRRALPSIATGPAAPSEIPEQTGYSASTMATDGRRVYAIFANADLAAFTQDGKQVWAKNIGIPKNPYGHASSLLTWEGKVIVQMDQGESEQNLSKIMALDGASGRVIWQRNRPVSASWATPTVVQTSAQAQIITLAVPWVIAYAARDGSELWRVQGINGEVTPSAIFAAGLVMAISPNEKLMAIRPDGKGDVTKTHVSWSAEDNVPDICSPVSNGELVFLLTTPGMLTCYDAKDGKKLWEQDLGLECHASPSLVGNRLYVVGSKGLVLVLEAGRTYRELGRNDLQEKIYASPAFVSGTIYLRGFEHLFCLRPSSVLAKRN